MEENPFKHGDVIKWKQFPRYWPFARGIHQWPVTQNFDDLFDLRLYKQSKRRRFKMPSRSLWRHSNDVGRITAILFRPQCAAVKMVTVTGPKCVIAGADCLSKC